MGKCCYCDLVQKKGCGRTFHKFPDDELTATKWKENIPLTNWEPSKGSLVCSHHFTEDCFEHSLYRIRLKPTSVPTVFGDSPSVCVFCRRKFPRPSPHSFFKFPLDNPDLLKKWLKAINRPNWKPTEISRVCSAHFENAYLRYVQGTWSLKENSVPTMFPSATATPGPPAARKPARPFEYHRKKSSSPSVLKVVPANDLPDTKEPETEFRTVYLTDPRETSAAAQFLETNYGDDGEEELSEEIFIQTLDGDELTAGPVQFDVNPGSPGSPGSPRSPRSPRPQPVEGKVEHDHSYDLSTKKELHRPSECQELLKENRRLLKLEKTKCKRLREK